MHPRERVLNRARLHLERGELLPLDLLVALDELGLSLVNFDHHPPIDVTKEISSHDQEHLSSSYNPDWPS
jgi:hypothetical protein